MISHTFAVCAYQDSPFLEECLRSLKRQSEKTQVILCTSTPSKYIQGMAELFEIPLYVREGESDIQADWNFAYEKAQTSLVTIAHQDDYYHKEYTRYVRECWEKYPDTTVFTTDCAVLKGRKLQKPDTIWRIKRLLRLPLRFHQIADRTWVKRASLCFGNPIICPSCTYNKEALGTPLFQSQFRFALDWDTMWELAARPGRFICAEEPLMRYRIHAGAETKACIADQRRPKEEIAMYEKIWPRPIARFLMWFYRWAYRAYQ